MFWSALYEWRWLFLCASVAIAAFGVGRAIGRRAATGEATHEILKALYPDPKERARRLEQIERDLDTEEDA